MSSLLVTIHDVTPRWFGQVKELWALCESRGVTPGLLVVPLWEGGHPIADAPEFVAWVRQCAGAGAELFLHGERHDEVGSPRNLGHWARAVLRTKDAGEFLTLDYAEARRRIDRGLETMRRLGMNPIGFVPPAWLATRDTHRAVDDAGLHVSEDRAGIYLRGRAKPLSSVSLSWNGRTPLWAHGSEMNARVQRWTDWSETPVRFTLHPQDLSHAATRRSIESELDLWMKRRPFSQYAALLEPRVKGSRP